MKEKRKNHFCNRFNRWLYGGSWSQILFLILFSVAVFFVFAAVMIALWKPHVGMTSEMHGRGWGDLLWQMYYYFADPGNQMSADWSSGCSRAMGMLMSTLGSIFLSGLLISTITNVFERRAERWRTGFQYLRLKNHVVIIGSDQMVHGLVNQLCDGSDDYIVVMTSTDVEQMRNSLEATLKDKKNVRRLIVNYGQRDSEEYLKAVGVARAKAVYILGDTSEFDEIESFHDSLNVKCLTIIAGLCKAEGRTGLPCHVSFEYKTTYHVFQYADLSPEITSHVDFHPFNFYDFWARKVFVAGYSKEEEITYKPLDHTPITDKDSEKFVHLVVIGMSKMGQAMALQAAHIAHYPNYKKKKTKITFIDTNGKNEMEAFKQKCGELFKVSRSSFIDADAWTGDDDAVRYGLADEYSHLVTDDDKEFIDVEWEFVQGADHHPAVQKLLTSYAEDENAILTVAVCLNLTHVSLRSAMHLPKVYYEKGIPVLVQQRKTSSMVTALNGAGFSEQARENMLYRNIVPFGMVYDCYDLHLATSVEICKRIAAVYDYYFKHKKLPEEIDPAAAERIWSNTRITKRWSNIFAAASIPTKLRCIGRDWDMSNPCQLKKLTAGEVELLAEVEHNRWNIEELLLGYRPVRKDEDERIDADRSLKASFKSRFIHYDIRPYEGLKEDDEGNLASVYDKVIVESLPLILNDIIER